jgi:hypothetical protein
MRVAVVGNSRDVLDRRTGAEIDACDVVIRLNSFRTRGHEAQVGSRTDVVAICLSPDIVTHALPHARCEYAPTQIVWTPSWRGRETNADVEAAMRTLGRRSDELVFCCDTGHKQLVVEWHERIYERASRRPGPKTSAADGRRFVPTTGFLTLQLARARYPHAEVVISGFGLASDADPRRFDWSGALMWDGHDLPTERELLLEGIAEGRWRQL